MVSLVCVFWWVFFTSSLKAKEKLSLLKLNLQYFEQVCCHSYNTSVNILLKIDVYRTLSNVTIWKRKHKEVRPTIILSRNLFFRIICDKILLNSFHCSSHNFIIELIYWSFIFYILKKISLIWFPKYSLVYHSKLWPRLILFFL